jgi:hypothetical protein
VGSDVYPTARVTGVKLNINMNYFNHGQEAKAGYKNNAGCEHTSLITHSLIRWPTLRMNPTLIRFWLK